MSRYELTSHAAKAIAERNIDLGWIDRVFRNPERTERDKLDPRLTHALGRIPQRGDRVLRVIYNGSVTPPLIVTAYFDRRQRAKP